MENEPSKWRHQNQSEIEVRILSEADDDEDSLRGEPPWNAHNGTFLTRDFRFG